MFTERISQLVSRAESLIMNAILEFGIESIVLSFNGGKDCTVMLNLLCNVVNRIGNGSISIKTVYVADHDTFPKVEQFVLESMIRCPFLKLYRYNSSVIDAYKTFLQTNDRNSLAVIVGVRRTDPYCSNLSKIQITDNSWPNFYRIHPILDWSYSDIWAYMDQSGIPYCKLYETGYTSVGSMEKTRPNRFLSRPDGTFSHARSLKDSQDEREGRD